MTAEFARCTSGWKRIPGSARFCPHCRQRDPTKFDFAVLITRLVPIALVVTLVIVGGSFLASTESGKRLLRSPAERAAYENGIESGTIAGGAFYIKDYLNKHPDVPRAKDWEELSRCEGKINCPEDPKLISHWRDGFTVGWEAARRRAVNAYFEYYNNRTKPAY